MSLKHPPKASDPRDRVGVSNYTPATPVVERERGTLDRTLAYGQTRWKAISAVQLSKKPLCERCAVFDITTVAQHADHIVPHRGNLELFWKGQLQSLCPSCHSYKTVQESKGIYLDYSDGSEQKIVAQ